MESEHTKAGETEAERMKVEATEAEATAAKDTEAVATRIGKICGQFQYIEITISIMVMGMINERQQIGQAVTCVLPFRRLCDVFLSLIRILSPDADFTARCKELIKEASFIENQRNTIIHSSLTRDEDGNIERIKFKVSRKSGLVIDTDPDYVTSLDETYSRMNGLIIDLKKLYKDGLGRGIFRSP